MAKTIAISDDVYELLRKVKLPGESFSDVIRRSFSRGVKLTDICGSGTLSKADWVRVQKRPSANPKRSHEESWLWAPAERFKG